MVFGKAQLKKLYKPDKNSSGEDNGQVTIIGGSELFHGAALLSLTAACRFCDMVFFATPEGSVGRIAEMMKSRLMSFIWIPWSEREDYIKKSDAVLIGPGLMRYHKENSKTKSHMTKLDAYGQYTKEISEELLQKFPYKKWVIDAGSLQTIAARFIPENSILTPNKKEFKLLFKSDFSIEKAGKMARKYKCIIAVKGPITYISDGKKIIEVHGGSAGLTKGGTGDVLSGLTCALLAKSDPMLAVSAASYVVKKTAEELERTVGINFSSDDLANKIPEVLHKLVDK